MLNLVIILCFISNESILSQEIQGLYAIVVQDQAPHKRVGAVELKGDDVDLLTDLVILLAQVHLQLVDHKGAWTNLEGVVPLEVDAANAPLAEHDGEWELMWIIERNPPHRDAISLPMRHVELDDGIWLLSVDRVNLVVVPSNNSEPFALQMDNAPDVVTDQVPLGAEHKSHLCVFTRLVLILLGSSGVGVPVLYIHLALTIRINVLGWVL